MNETIKEHHDRVDPDQKCKYSIYSFISGYLSVHIHEEAEHAEFDYATPMLLPGQVPGCRKAPRYCSRGGKAQSEIWKNQSQFGGSQACSVAGDMGSSDSLTSRHCWESWKRREWNGVRGLMAASSLGLRVGVGDKGAPACPSRWLSLALWMQAWWQL